MPTPEPRAAGRPPTLDNPTRVIVRVGSNQLQDLDAAAQEARITRSEAIRWAIEEWLASRPEGDRS